MKEKVPLILTKQISSISERIISPFLILWSERIELIQFNVKKGIMMKINLMITTVW